MIAAHYRFAAEVAEFTQAQLRDLASDFESIDIKVRPDGSSALSARMTGPMADFVDIAAQIRSEFGAERVYVMEVYETSDLAEVHVLGEGGGTCLTRDLQHYTTNDGTATYSPLETWQAMTSDGAVEDIARSILGMPDWEARRIHERLIEDLDLTPGM